MKLEGSPNNVLSGVDLFEKGRLHHLEGSISLSESPKLRACSKLDGSIRSRNATWAAADNLKGTVTKS